MEIIHKSVAITKNGKDCLRIRPWGSPENRAEIKFSFFDGSFIIRKFDLNTEDDILLYKPRDYGRTPHELTYHNSNNYHSKASLLPKYKDDTERQPISQEIIDLDLKNLLVPIPVCRVTVNQEPQIPYNPKKYHNNIELSSKYNTTEIFISSAKYDFDILKERFPNIVEFLFPITTIDFLIYGAGMGSEPIMNKMLENNEPITALESDMIGKYRLYYRTYELVKTDSFRLYSKQEYSQKNFIEFFDNIEYLDLLATTNIGFKIPGTNRYDSKPAYQRDIDHLKRIGFHKDYIKRWLKRFKKKELEYKKHKKFRSGIITG
jgi:hypothetical protein